MGGSATSALNVSKCEKFYPFFGPEHKVSNRLDILLKSLALLLTSKPENLWIRVLQPLNNFLFDRLRIEGARVVIHHFRDSHMHGVSYSRDKFCPLPCRIHLCECKCAISQGTNKSLCFAFYKVCMGTKE